MGGTTAFNLPSNRSTQAHSPSNMHYPSADSPKRVKHTHCAVRAEQEQQGALGQEQV